MIDHVVARSEIAVLDFQRGEEAVQIGLRHLRSERELPQPVAVQGKEVGLLALWPVQDGRLVDVEIGGAEAERESIGSRGATTLFIEPLIRFAECRAGRMVQTAGGECFLHLQDEVADVFN